MPAKGFTSSHQVNLHTIFSALPVSRTELRSQATVRAEAFVFFYQRQVNGSHVPDTNVNTFNY